MPMPELASSGSKSDCAYGLQPLLHRTGQGQTLISAPFCNNLCCSAAYKFSQAAAGHHDACMMM